MSAGAVAATGENLFVSSAEEQSNNAPTGPTDKVNQDEFLQLLVKQMTNQDPLNPTDNREFMSQLAQLQSLEEQVQTNELLTSMLAGNKVASAASMIGTQVTGRTAGGVEQSGVVSSIRVKGEVAYLKLVDGGQIPLENVEEVTPPVYEESAAGGAG
jgi:flagellar basal-body rod modification protein FlgD